jgi:hypothetical protein
MVWQGILPGHDTLHSIMQFAALGGEPVNRGNGSASVSSCACVFRVRACHAAKATTHNVVYREAYSFWYSIRTSAVLLGSMMGTGMCWVRVQDHKLAPSRCRNRLSMPEHKVNTFDGYKRLS